MDLASNIRKKSQTPVNYFQKLRKTFENSPFHLVNLFFSSVYDSDHHQVAHHHVADKEPLACKTQIIVF